MLNPIEVLREHAETMPKWLANYNPGDPFPREEFFRSRIVYYPGSGTDGHPLRIFGEAHAAHCFVYADSRFPAKNVDEQLADELNIEHPKGYKLVELTHPSEKELTPNGWTQHCSIAMTRHNIGNARPPEGPFARFAVLERLKEYGNDHGPKRIAYLHVGGDGYATFDALFCQENFTLPYAVLLQNHGFGGNWNRDGFGGGGSLLWQLANESGKPLPGWLFVGKDNTKPWPGYHPASGPDRGGCNWGQNRYLYTTHYNKNKERMPTTMNLVTKLTEFCKTKLDLSDASLSNSYYYTSLPLCVIDAVFSIGANYTSTTNTVMRYCKHVDADMFRDFESNFPPAERQRKIDVLLNDIESFATFEEVASKLFGNKQRTSARNGILKAEAVKKFATCLQRHGIQTFQDMAEIECDAYTQLENQIKDIPGQNVSWSYFLMLAGSENHIKPDRMILRFICDVTGENVPSENAQALLSGVIENFRYDYPTLTLRKLDHEIWKFQKERNKG